MRRRMEEPDPGTLIPFASKSLPGTVELSGTDLIQMVLIPFMRVQLIMEDQRALGITNDINFDSAFQIASITSAVGNALNGSDWRNLARAPTAVDVRQMRWNRERYALEKSMSTMNYWKALPDKYYSDGDTDEE